MPACQQASRTILWSFFVVLVLTAQTQAAGRPAWWADAQAEAARDGYALVDDSELEALRKDGRTLIVDVRPDYEFARSHVPGAVNMEFDLGDQQGLSMERARRLAELLGPDHGRTVIFFCRSFM